MLFLVILLIALGWAGWLWAWGRDRIANNRGFDVSALSGSTTGRARANRRLELGVPTTRSQAKKRRSDVLKTLAGIAFATFLIANSWAVMWWVHVAIDVALVVFAIAVYAVENRALVGAAKHRLAAPADAQLHPQLLRLRTVRSEAPTYR